MAVPRLISRREFLRDTAVAGALAAGGSQLLAACAPGGPTNGADIARIAIHPAIGIARVGNSPDLFYFGPDVPSALPRSAGGFKDAAGALARQAARFRVYGIDANGKVVRELSASDGEITWTVDVANKKAAWYEFKTAFDLPIAESVPRRNASLVGDARAQLVAASTGKRIAGAGSTPVKLDGGTFMGGPVEFGELLTDEKGRLVVLPGDGRGYSPTNAPLNSFSDNDDWCDNICDGSVRVSIKIGDRVIGADPAWLVVTPPNYGPAISTGMVTIYDTAASALVDANTFDAGALSFARDILPLFARMVDMQWVNEGYLETNGWGSPSDWLSKAQSDKLADPSAANRAWRTELFSQFRDPSFVTARPDAMPSMYGDGTTIPATNDYQWLAVTPLQYRRLKTWADGGFTDDRGAMPTYAQIEDVPIADQPAALDRAALESCLGGAFHPGIEAPWTMRVASMWAAPFRLAVQGTEPKLRDYGDQLTPALAMGPDGPVHGVTPGDLSMWMGVPWQSDAGSCRSGYERSLSLVLPTFWPARIPNHVLADIEYRIVMDRTRPMADRLAAFRKRRDWERHIARSTRPETLALMMANWTKLGVVTEQPGPGDGAFPDTMKVETALGFDYEPEVVFAADKAPYEQ